MSTPRRCSPLCPVGIGSYGSQLRAINNLSKAAGPRVAIATLHLFFDEGDDGREMISCSHSARRWLMRRRGLLTAVRIIVVGLPLPLRARQLPRIRFRITRRSLGYISCVFVAA